MEVKTDGGKGKEENLISSLPLKSNCERIIHQTVKLPEAVKFQRENSDWQVMDASPCAYSSKPKF